jgi:hypothetical protein
MPGAPPTAVVRGCIGAIRTDRVPHSWTVWPPPLLLLTGPHRARPELARVSAERAPYARGLQGQAGGDLKRILCSRLVLPHCSLARTGLQHFYFSRLLPFPFCALQKVMVFNLLDQCGARLQIPEKQVRQEAMLRSRSSCVRADQPVHLRLAQAHALLPIPLFDRSSEPSLSSQRSVMLGRR